MKNNKRYRIIHVSSQGVELVPGVHLLWSATNLPLDAFSIHPRGFFPWRVIIKSYDVEERHLTLEVVDYYPENNQSFFEQKLKGAIRSLQFEKLDWYYFASFLSSYRKADLLPFILDHPDIYVPDMGKKRFHYRSDFHPDDLKFVQGGVTTWVDLPALSEPVEIRIENPHIIPQFEFIKSYFFKSLGRKKIQVDIDLCIHGSQVHELKAQSKIIDRINEEMVSTLKISRVLGLQKSPKVVVVDKHLFTADEIFDQYYDEPDANLFQQNPLDVLRNLAEQGVVRNRKQLEYLAVRKHRDSQKIFITLSPNFGFLFIASSSGKNHFIWELINSHATYLWSFSRSADSLENQIKTVERIIGMIRAQGRDYYRNEYQMNFVHVPYDFNIVIHRHADKGIVDPFPGWKHRLEELLQ